jgi:hypothetical protein
MVIKQVAKKDLNPSLFRGIAIATQLFAAATQRFAAATQCFARATQHNVLS